MKYPKITNSKDGIKRMTIKMEYRVGYEDLKIAFGNLIYMMNGLDLFNNNIDSHKVYILSNITKSKIYTELKKLLYERGDDIEYVPEGWSPDCNQIGIFVNENMHLYFEKF